jgi:hypothetical protein
MSQFFFKYFGNPNLAALFLSRLDILEEAYGRDD